MIRFHLDRNVKLNFYEQIKGQLLSAIYCGKIQEGDRMPSIRELSEDLKVSHKTIRKIYQRLAEEEYLDLIQGSGAFLKQRTGEGDYQQMRRRAIFRLLTDSLEKARTLGLTTQKFAVLMEGFVTGSGLKKLRLVVVDHEEEAFIFSRELKLRLSVEADPVSLGQELNNGSEELLRQSDYLLTTSWHMDEVRELARRFEKRLLEIKPSHTIYTEILEAARHLNIAIVVQDEKTLHASWDIFMNLYHPSTQKKFWIAPVQRDDLVEKIIEEADLIFVSPMCWDTMRKKTPADKELKTYENFISEETIRHLKELQLLG